MVPFTCYYNHTLVEDNGDWAGNTATYDFNYIDHTFDGTSDANYYLYKFEFYEGTIASHNPSDSTEYTLRLKKNTNDSAVVLSDVYFSFDGEKFPATVTKDGTTTVLTVDGTNKTKVANFGEKMLHFTSNVGTMSRNIVSRLNSLDYVSTTDAFTNVQSVSGISFTKLGLMSVAEEADYYVYSGTVYDYFTFPIRNSSVAPPTLNSTGVRLRLRKYDKDDTPTFPNTLFAGEDFLMSPWNYKQLFPGNFATVPGKDYREYVFRDVTLPFTVRIRSVNSYKNTFYIDGKAASNSADFTYTFTEKKPYIDLTYVPGTGIDDTFNHYVTGNWRISVTQKGKTFVNGAAVSAISNKAYTGSQIKPSLTVKVNGKKLAVGTDYTVKYGANRNIGKGTATITGKGSYSGTKKVTFQIVPKKTAVAKVAAAKKQMKVTWKKVAAAQTISKYEVRYRVKGTAAWKSKTFAASASSGTIKSLVSGKRYQVQVRSYKTVASVKYYSSWSTVKTSGTVK